MSQNLPPLERSDEPDWGELPELPAGDGPFVEVSPGAWVRADAVIAVEAYADHDWRELRDAGHRLHRREYRATVLVAGGRGGDPTWWRSPYPTATLREVLRLAAHGEDLRLLRAVARLVTLSHGSVDDGR